MHHSLAVLLMADIHPDTAPPDFPFVERAHLRFRIELLFERVPGIEVFVHAAF